jgi:hypothetical protein
MKKIFLFIFLIIFLNSCQSVSEGFTLKKKNNADEFLVEKKNPLVLPPNYNDLPTPRDVNSSDQDDIENFEVTIKKSSSKKNVNKKIQPSSTEESILKNIKKDESN